MTVDELLAHLKALPASGDMPLKIQAFGGLRAGRPLANVSLGFDWDAGCVILHPDVPLTLQPEKPPPPRRRFHTWKCQKCGSSDIRTKTDSEPRRACPHCGDRCDKTYVGFTNQRFA